MTFALRIALYPMEFDPEKLGMRYAEVLQYSENSGSWQNVPKVIVSAQSVAEHLDSKEKP